MDIYSYHEGKYIEKRGLRYLLNFPYPLKYGGVRGALAPLKINIPLPLNKGKGIKGIGLLIIKGEEEKLKKRGEAPLKLPVRKMSLWD